ncbi:MAG TPA: DUF6599 family protein [Candidatus Acidoferrum sp.]|nr:DUF6599 family protein [Candidatus Acidoferrum sp.]
MRLRTSLSFTLLFVLVFAFASAANCFAQTPAPKPLPDRFGSWASSTVKVKPAEQDVALLTEAGLEQSVARAYLNGSQPLSVSLERFHDPSGAYEVYTALLDTDSEPSTVGQFTAIGHGRLIMLIGNFLVIVEQPELASTADLKELWGSVRKSADTTPLPPIRAFLPLGFADGSQRYALGPAAFQGALNKLGESEFAPLTHEAGFDFGAEAIFANYQKAKESGVLLLIDYPTPQLAEQHLRHMDAVLSPAQKQAGTTVERKGSLLSIVLRPPSVAFAEELRSEVHYQTEVTWNEPTHKLTDPSWAVILSRIFIVTLLFMGLAIALGIAYGIVRVLLKNLFPGKILDRPGQMEVLQLGLSGKRIDPRDFY